MNYKTNYFFLLVLIYLLISCKDSESKQAQSLSKRGAISSTAMVVSARSEASQIGSDILKKGGNAFDAMMATEMALAVTYPYAGNLGGGGFMVFRLANGDVGSLDYREKAPLASSRDMYLDEKGEVIENKSTMGAFSVGVPGTIAGIFAAHEKLGKLPVPEVLQPVIDLATKGYVITEKQQARFNNFDSIFRVVNGKQILYSNQSKVGDTLKNLKLAETLKRIAQNGKDEFYKGETGKLLVNYLNEKGGIITLEDIEKYEAKWRDPIIFNYKDLRIISMSPPSSGGICLAQIMKMIEPYDLKSYGHNSLKSIQVITEAERRAYADRSYFLGDPEFVEIPVKTLMSDVYLNDRMKDFSFEKATPSDSISYGKIVGYESNETTHYSIAMEGSQACLCTCGRHLFYLSYQRLSPGLIKLNHTAILQEQRSQSGSVCSF